MHYLQTEESVIEMRRGLFKYVRSVEVMDLNESISRICLRYNTTSFPEGK